MPLFKRRSGPAEVRPVRPVIENLESRDYFSSQLLVTFPSALPASAVAGVVENQKIAVDIANDGPDRFKGPFTLTLFASTDQALDQNDAQILQHSFPGAFVIPSGRHRTFRFNIHEYPQNLNDNYFVLGEVTPLDVVGASSSTIQILPKRIDFAATVPTIHRNGLVGHVLPVVVDVKNNGNVRARGNLVINFGESTDPSGSNPVDLANLSRRIIIQPGKTMVLHYLVRLPLGIPTGNQFIVANVDPMDVYNDPNLLDNIGVTASPITVT